MSIMSEFAQHVVVTLVALAAALVVVRRVFGVVAPQKKPAPACAACAASKARPQPVRVGTDVPRTARAGRQT